MKNSLVKISTGVALAATTVIAAAAPAQAARFRAWDGAGTHGTLLVDSSANATFVDVADDRTESVWNQQTFAMNGRNWNLVRGGHYTTQTFTQNSLYNVVQSPNTINHFEKL